MKEGEKEKNRNKGQLGYKFKKLTFEYFFKKQALGTFLKFKISAFFNFDKRD